LLSTGKEELKQKSIQLFDQALQEDENVPGKPKHVESMLGRAKNYEKMKKYD